MKWPFSKKKKPDETQLPMHIGHLPQPTPPIKHYTTPLGQSSVGKSHTSLPQKKDGAPLAYKYSVPFVPSDLNAALLAISEGHNQLTAKQMEKDVHLFSEETDLGVLTEKNDMVTDWIKRSDPLTIILERTAEGSSYQVTIAFYRDKQKHNAHREQTVFALTGYKGEAKQNAILYINAGDELEAEEDFEKDGHVTVSYLGDIIGSFPKKYADQFINEGAALVVFDHGEDLEDGDITKPFVKVYW